jgi:biopolymer transport protein ExbD
MQFATRKRRGTPAVIIVSLIDVLIVVLIFMMVTTTFKQQPALKLALPESNQKQNGATPADAVYVTIPKNGLLYFKGSMDPVTSDKLQQKLKEAAAANPNMTLAINADTEAPWGQIVKVRDAAKAANIKNVSASVRNGATP